ncbi:hypothetical protein ES708_10512 [subsurface metagenome]
MECHQNLFPNALSTDGDDAHLYYTQHHEELRCLNCHLFVGHYNKAAIHASNIEFGKVEEINSEVFTESARGGEKPPDRQLQCLTTQPKPFVNGPQGSQEKRTGCLRKQNGNMPAEQEPMDHISLKAIPGIFQRTLLRISYLALIQLPLTLM